MRMFHILRIPNSYADEQVVHMSGSLYSFFLTGCVEKNGYYTEGENNVISLVCDVTWSTENTIHDAGETSREIYQFKKDGTCTRTIIWTNKNEEESKTEIYYRWAFYDQGSSTIYFGESHYWDIEDLTSTKFAVYNRFGEYGSLDMSREYMELSPLK